MSAHLATNQRHCQSGFSLFFSSACFRSESLASKVCFQWSFLFTSDRKISVAPLTLSNWFWLSCACVCFYSTSGGAENKSVLGSGWRVMNTARRRLHPNLTPPHCGDCHTALTRPYSVVTARPLFLSPFLFLKFFNRSFIFAGWPSDIYTVFYVELVIMNQHSQRKQIFVQQLIQVFAKISKWWKHKAQTN